MKTVHVAAFILTVVGALNWGLVGLLQYNVVESLLGTTGLANFVYVLVGASAVYIALTHSKDCKTCKEK